VEEGPDRWARPVSDTATQGLLVSGKKRGEGAGAWAGWAERKKGAGRGGKRGREVSRPSG
jgi:hypothetical protein